MEKKNNIGIVFELRDFILRGFILNMEFCCLLYSLVSVIVYLVLCYGSLLFKLGFLVGLLVKFVLYK